MNVEEAILLLDRLCKGTEEQDSLTDEVNPVIEFNVSSNQDEQQVEHHLDLSTSLPETEVLENLFEEM